MHVEAGSHIRVEGLLLCHVWLVIDTRNNHLFLPEVDSSGTSFHRVIDLDYGNYNIGTLAVELQKQLRQGTRITDGEWTVTSDQEGRPTLNQSSDTFQSEKLYSGSDVRGQTTTDQLALLDDGRGRKLRSNLIKLATSMERRRYPGGPAQRR